jgi:hypothetical protein
MRAQFRIDLEREMSLSTYLDKIYEQLNINLVRIRNLDLQHQGVDLKFDSNGVEYYIDEKAQLNYINSNLPTFAFEISYYKDDSLNEGWLLDGRKITTHYFLITDIQANEKKDGSLEFSSVQIISIHRDKLLFELDKLGLTNDRLKLIDKELRRYHYSGKKEIKELDIVKEGSLYLSTHLVEKPLNLVLKLEFLIGLGVAKRIYSGSASH